MTERKSPTQRNTERTKSYNSFDEFMAHIEGMLGKDSAVYKSYEDVYKKDLERRKDR